MIGSRISTGGLRCQTDWRGGQNAVKMVVDAVAAGVQCGRKWRARPSSGRCRSWRALAGRPYCAGRLIVSAVIQLSSTCGHRKIPHPLVNPLSIRAPVDDSVHGPAIAHVPTVVGLTTPDFSVSFNGTSHLEVGKPARRFAPHPLRHSLTLSAVLSARYVFHELRRRPYSPPGDARPAPGEPPSADQRRSASAGEDPVRGHRARH